MKDVIFIPKKHAVNAKEVTYHVNCVCIIAAEEIATKAFIEEYGIKTQYYDRVVITETRVL